MSLTFSPLHPVFVAEGGIIGGKPQIPVKKAWSVHG
jgi:hypothetical protein